MQILVACECSGAVRNAFRLRGHEAWSCDLQPADPSDHPEFDQYHLQRDARETLEVPWDLVIAHPPCTRLSVSGARWFKLKPMEQWAAIQFFMIFVKLTDHIPRVCIENPISIMSTEYRKPDQIIQPWQFGHPEKKSTCLWLKGLPKLVPTDVVKAEMEKLPKKQQSRIHYMSPGKNRGKLRSVTYPGIAKAMAEQWG